MYSARKLIHSLLLTGTLTALMTVGVHAADTAIPCEAVVSSASSSMVESLDSRSETVVELENDDIVVVLSISESGYAETAYQQEDVVYSGYLPLRDLTFRAQGDAQVLLDGTQILSSPDADASSVMELAADTTVKVYGYDNGWFFVSYQGFMGYLPQDRVSCPMLTSGSLNLRTEPNTDSEIIVTLPTNTPLLPEAAEEGWYQITYGDQVGYVSAEFTKATPAMQVENPLKTPGEAAVEYAAQFIGNPYKWGGTSLTNGCDCSGFVMQVFANYGLSLPHSSRGMRSRGEKVALSDIQVGDVVCYSGHVGIYAGNGQIINALNRRSGICYTDLHYSSIITIRRML